MKSVTAPTHIRMSFRRGGGGVDHQLCPVRRAAQLGSGAKIAWISNAMPILQRLEGNRSRPVRVP